MRRKENQIIGITETPSGPIFSVQKDTRTQAQAWADEKKTLMQYYFQKFYLKKAMEVDPEFRNN
jgi:hypothetical protein